MLTAAITDRLPAQKGAHRTEAVACLTVTGRLPGGADRTEAVAC